MTETEKFTDFTDMHTPTLSVQLRFLYNYPQVFDNKDFDVDLRGYAKFSIIRYCLTVAFCITPRALLFQVI